MSENILTVEAALLETGTPPASKSAGARPCSPRETYALAATKMRRGKRLVISGFGVAVLGMVGYCVASLAPQAAGASSSLVALGLGVIGAGTLLWLVGSVLYFTGAMDADPEGPEAGF